MRNKKECDKTECAGVASYQPLEILSGGSKMSAIVQIWRLIRSLLTIAVLPSIFKADDGENDKYDMSTNFLETSLTATMNYDQYIHTCIVLHLS